MITFEYNGKIYKPSNLENKLKKLGITINDVKIIDDTKTNAEKEREERSQQTSNNEETVDVYWDNQSKGWYIVDRRFPYNSESGIRFFQEIEKGHYRLVQHDVCKNTLQDFFKENFQKVLNNTYIAN